MKTKTLVSLIALLGFALVATAQTSSTFTYQGRLKIGGGNPDPGQLFDYRFTLFDVSTGGIPVTAGVGPSCVPVTDGVFTVPLDFGSNAFNGAPRWLEIEVRPATTNPAAPYQMLSPRQLIASAPQSFFAEKSAMASNVSPNASLNLTGPVQFNPVSGPPFVVGNTQRVANLSADLLDGLDGTAFWRRDTNGGVSSIIDPEDRPIEIRAQNNRLLRLQPGNANLGSSLVGGSANNNIATGVPGSVVAGGRNNLIESNAGYAVVTGGDGNQVGAGATGSTIGGGSRQQIGLNSPYSGVFAGYNNVVSSNSRFAGVLVGDNGKVRENSDFSVVLSGENNSVGPQATYAAILSGGANQIEAGANVSVIASGQQNIIHSNAYSSGIVAGQLNEIQNGANRSFVGGGDYNTIGPASYEAFLGGGTHNKIEFNAPYSAILAGYYNLVRSNASSATVLGGVSSVAGAPFAIAAGHQAKAEHSGSIVLADGQYADFASSNANEFAVRAAGGVRFVTAGAGIFVDGQKILSGTGTVVTNGGDAETLNGFTSGDFWRLTGNAGTTPGVDFLGTTDNRALELKVNNTRALRLEPTVGSPNLIGGDDGNSIPAGVSGATIGGGGSPGLFGVTFPNRVTDNFGVVAGGFDNRAGNDNANVQDSFGATVSGGYANVAAADAAVAVGGASNSVQAVFGVIAGGLQNTIEARAARASIGGGFRNWIQTNSADSTIGGGDQNSIRQNTDGATIAGGSGNFIESQTHWATIAGGFSHGILGQAYSASIGGGERNLIGTNAQFATIPGGAYAHARDYGQLAYASGLFAEAGDAQTSIRVLRGTSTTSSPRELFLDGLNERMKVPPGAVWTFDILVAANDGEPGLGGIGVASYQIRGAVANLLGVTIVLGTPVKDVLFESIAAWDVNVEGDEANSAFVIKVIGSSNNSVRWVASVRTVEVVN